MIPKTPNSFAKQFGAIRRFSKEAIFKQTKTAGCYERLLSDS